jgi:hypothetical protein
MNILGIIASSKLGVDNGDFESIATGTVTAGNTSSVITFSSIPSTYTHLQLRMLARATASDTMYVRFNNDSGATNYDNHRMNGNGSSVGSDARINFSALFVSSRGYGIASTADIGSAVIMDILDYTNTNKYKVTRTLSGQELNTSNSDLEFTSGSWKNTAAVNRIDISINSSTLAQYTHIALYGIRSA